MVSTTRVFVAAQPAPATRTKADLALFERKAALSKELGATHMLLTDGLPLATWQTRRTRTRCGL
jgi:hypothetical protein